MVKYSKEWKEKKRRWIQKHTDCWKIHYIQNNTEMSMGKYFTAQEAREEMKRLFA